MRPTKMSSDLFTEIPRVLSLYLDGAKNQWIEANAREGAFKLLSRPGIFVDLESLAVERKQLLDLLGPKRARAHRFCCGFEQGRRDAARHYQLFAENGKIALQAGQVFGQVQGRFAVEFGRFEFDLDAQTLYREIVLHNNAEASVHRMASEDNAQCACWATAGYLSGQISEIVERPVITLETECVAKGDAACRFISKLDAEWGTEADWVRQALRVETVDAELAKRDEMLAAAQKAARRAQGALNDINKRLHRERALESYVAGADCMRPVVARARQVMDSDVAVLLCGEIGAGREMLARAIHYGSPRKGKSFVTLDCIGLPEKLMGQELAGFTKGGVLGAAQDYAGAFARADGGTLYLNEVAKLGLDTQGVLLRAIKERAIAPLGYPEAVPADVRVMAATQYDPRELIEAGKLREDLYYAVATCKIDIPPLRERGDDVLRLAEAFLEEFRDHYGRPDIGLSKDIKAVLLECAWPGNVRQLRHVVEHAVIMSQGRELETADLPEEVLATRWKRPPKELTPEVINAALARTHGNKSTAAELLGVGRTTLWRAMQRLGIS